MPKKISTFEHFFQAFCDRGEINFRPRAGIREDSLGLLGPEPADWAVLPCTAANGRARDLDASQYGRRTLCGTQDEVQTMSVDDHKRQAWISTFQNAAGEPESFGSAPHLEFESAKHVEDGSHEGYRQLEPSHLQCDCELEKVAFRERTAAPPASRIPDVRHDDVLFAEVDEPVLRNVERLGCLG